MMRIAISRLAATLMSSSTALILFGMPCVAQGIPLSRQVNLEEDVSKLAPTAPTSPPSVNAIAAIPLASLRQTRERPIFSPSRRAAPSAKAIASSGSQSLVLLGAISSGPDSIAIIQDRDSKAVMRLKVGQSVFGWQLLRVDGRSAKLASSSGTEMVLEIEK